MKNMNLNRRMMMQISAAAGVSVFVSGLINPAHAGAPDSIKLRALRAITTTDPGYMVGGTDMALQFACLARLVSYTDSPTEWDWQNSDFVNKIELSSDGKQIAFDLKPGIMWYDGTTHEVISELNAEDVKYSLERIKETQWKDKANSLDHVEVTGSHSGIIHLKEPFAPIFLTWLADGTGTILCKPAMEAMGGKFDGLFTFYCGPYRMSEWVQKQSFSMEPNPNWGGKAPHIAKVKFIIIEDDKTAEIAFEAGEVDITSISTDTLARYQKKGAPDGSTVIPFPGLFWQWIGMNTDHPKLKDKRVRQAIQAAIDVDMIIEGAFAGIAPRARGVVTPGLVGYRKTTRYERPDLDEARALLKEAGVDGLELTLQCENTAERIAVATIAQANLAEIGITLDVRPLDAGPFWNLGIEEAGEDWKDLQLWIMRFLDSPDPSQMTQWYTSGQVGIWNWERWTDEEFDRLHAEGLIETDNARREEIYLRMQEIMEDTGAYVWLVHEPLAVIMRDNLNSSIRPSGSLLYLADFGWQDT